MVAKARRALTLKQYDAARSWLRRGDRHRLFLAGCGSRDSAICETALAEQKRFSANVVNASELTLVKSVQTRVSKKSGAGRDRGLGRN